MEPAAHQAMPGRRYRGQSPDERRAERRRRLVEAGLELFGTVGYAATSIEAVCSRAGVTARHFYEHFDSREALMIAVFEEQATAVMREVVEATEAEDPHDLDGRIRAGVGAFLRGVLGDPRRARVLSIESVGVSRDMERRRRSAMHAYARFVAGQIAAIAGVADSGADVDWLSLALVGGVNELIVEWISGMFRPPVELLVTEVSAFFHAAGELTIARWVAEGRLDRATAERLRRGRGGLPPPEVSHVEPTAPATAAAATPTTGTVPAATAASAGRAPGGRRRGS